MIAEDSVHQIGCIHTCQGLELDYIGVIIAEDFVILDGVVFTYASKRSSNDRSIRGYKTMLKKDPEKATQLTADIIKNTYRTLMTRGQKGCYIYCVDAETGDYFRKITQPVVENASNSLSPYQGLSLPIVPLEEANPYVTHVPIYDLHAAGSFSEAQMIEGMQWVEWPDHINVSEGMFVMRLEGESMNRRIPNGSWCLFKSTPGGTRNGKVVLVQHRYIDDPDHGGSYTVKVYHSDKSNEGDVSFNTRIVIKPDTNAFGYSSIELEDDGEELTIIGEYLAVISD
jgi:phage repressor protein C with HTH and peptisase S24 domain